MRHDHATKNPVTVIEHPVINRDEGTTLAFSKLDARKLLDLPKSETEEPSVEGWRGSGSADFG